jgi:hypothetical protein
MEHQEASTSTRLDEAATKAFELIQEYAEVNDPHSEQEDNPWRNPEAIYKALDQARSELNQAWKEQQQQQNQPKPKSGAAGEETKTEDIEEFRALYMDMITDAFSDVLENMRENPEEDIDVDVLVDCLQSGMDMLSPEERDGFFQALDDDDGDDLDDDETPHHELHRRELGLDVSVTSF